MELEDILYHRQIEPSDHFTDEVMKNLNSKKNNTNSTFGYIAVCLLILINSFSIFALLSNSQSDNKRHQDLKMIIEVFALDK